MKTILVTGGSGYIGSHACLVLLEANYKVIALDSNINSKESSLERILRIGIENKKNFRERLFFIKGDLRDQKFLNNVFNKAKQKGMNIDAVMHFAGLKSVNESIENPISYWDNNVNGSLNLFKVMADNNCKSIVFSSSATVYGAQKSTPINENMSLNPINPYGETKVAVEKILQDIYKGYGHSWSVVTLRYFNPIGAHETGIIGEEPFTKPNNIFPLICNVAQKKIKKLYIYGNNWPTPDGTCIRDYIHVMDLAEAHLSALRHIFTNDPSYLNLNIGTGNGTSVLELIKMFEESNNCNINYQFTERREGDTSVVIANNKLALSILNWAPKRNLKEMCIDGWKSVTINDQYSSSNNLNKDKKFIGILNYL